MRSVFNTNSTQAQNGTKDHAQAGRPALSQKVFKAVEGHIGIAIIFGITGGSVLASEVFTNKASPRSENIPAWVDDFYVRPSGKTCRIEDLKTNKDYTVEEGQKLKLPRGFTVASSPSSCNVTAPNKKTCQLRGYPIAPIC